MVGRLPEPAGPLLEARIERRVFGRQAVHPAPACSRVEDAVDRLVREIERRALRCAISRFGADWYAIWWAPGRNRPERLATGSGATRALAICRAVANLPNGALAGDPAPDGSLSFSEVSAETGG